MSLPLPQLLAALVVMAAGAGASPKPEIAMVVVSLDGVSKQQVDYARFIAERTGDVEGPFLLTPGRLRAEDFNGCTKLDLAGAVACVRAQIGRKRARTARPPLVVVVLADTSPGDEPYGDHLDASCVGVAEISSDPHLQTVRLSPMSQMMHSPDPMNREIAAMNACMTAAVAEADAD